MRFLDTLWDNVTGRNFSKVHEWEHVEMVCHVQIIDADFRGIQLMMSVLQKHAIFQREEAVDQNVWNEEMPLHLNAAHVRHGWNKVA